MPENINKSKINKILVFFVFTYIIKCKIIKKKKQFNVEFFIGTFFQPKI